MVLVNTQIELIYIAVAYSFTHRDSFQHYIINYNTTRDYLVWNKDQAAVSYHLEILGSNSRPGTQPYQCIVQLFVGLGGRPRKVGGVVGSAFQREVSAARPALPEVTSDLGFTKCRREGIWSSTGRWGKVQWIHSEKFSFTSVAAKSPQRV